MTRTLGLSALVVALAALPVSAGEQAYIRGIDVSALAGKPRLGGGQG